MQRTVQCIYQGEASALQQPVRRVVKRVAAYCRISTDLTAQQTSLETQVNAFRQKISQHVGWRLADIYADDGVTGTSAAKRPEFMRMVRDCEAGKIDYIITKSISRFARNTLECLSYIRYLQGLGVQLWFEKEGIDTGTAFSEMLLTILAAFAQEESRSISENQKWSIRKRFEAGIEKWSFTFGYRRSQQGEYLIHPLEGETVRRIFYLYEHGMSMAAIARQMEKENRPSAFCSRWTASHVHTILCNEKYVGDVMMQKKYTVDHLTHREVRNDQTVVPSYYVRDHHTPIISRKQYDRVQTIRKLKSSHSGPAQYPYADRLHCPRCGAVMRQHEAAWHCSGCRQYHVTAKALDRAVLAACDRKHEEVHFFWLDEMVEEIVLAEDGGVTLRWRKER